MTRTLITRDLAEPSGAEFDASVDVYNDTDVVATLGTIHGTFPKRPVGPSTDPDNDDGWSFALGSAGGWYEKQADSTWNTGFQVSEWWWFNSLSTGSASHYFRMLNSTRTVSPGNPYSHVRLNGDATIDVNHPGTGVVSTGFSIPIREWFEFSFAFRGGENQARLLMRSANDSSWTEIYDFSPIAFTLDDFRGGKESIPSGGTMQGRARLGGISIYSIDSINDALVVDDSIGAPPPRRHHWWINSSTGDDNNVGSQARPWASVSKANTEITNVGILPTALDRASVDDALATIRDAPTNADHVGNDAALESALDAFYLPADVLHIGNADFGDDAIWVRTDGLVVTSDGGTPELRKTLDAALWTPHATHADVYQISDSNALDTVVWEDNKWMTRTDFDTDDATSIANLAAGPFSAWYVATDGLTVYVKAGADPATSGRVYTRSRKRATSGEGTSAILVGARDVQVRDMTLSGTCLADSETGDGIQAYCVQWGPNAGGICESRDITVDKGGKHIHGVTNVAANSAMLRRRVTYGSGTPYAGILSWTTDVDFSGSSEAACYYYDCKAPLGIIGEIGQVDGDPNRSGPFYTSHGSSFDWCKQINCDFGRGTYFDQGVFPSGFTMVDVRSGGSSISGGWASPLVADRCRSDDAPFGTWANAPDMTLTNSIMVVNRTVTSQGFTKINGDAFIQGCTIDTRGNASSDDVSLKSLWDAEDTTGQFDFHGDLLINEKGFGILANGPNRTVSSDYNVLVYETDVRLSTEWDGLGSFDTFAEWQARGHDLNSELVNNTFGLKLLEDYQPGPLSPLDDFTPVEEVPSVEGTLDYNEEKRPTSGAITTGAKEAMFASENISPVRGETITIRKGYDYTIPGVTAIVIEEASVNEWSPEWLQADSFRFHAFSKDPCDESVIDVPAILNTPDIDGIRSFTIEIERESTEDIATGIYSYQIYGRFEAADDESYLIEGTMHVKPGR